MEAAADRVLDREEEERVAGITELLDIYRDKFNETYRLDDSFLGQVEYRKEYYNKTADEKERKDSLEAQFAELKRRQDARDASVRIVRDECARLGAAETPWLALLDYKDVATVLSELRAEYEGAAKEKRTAEIVPDDAPKTDFPGKVKTMTVEIEYPCDMGDLLNETFGRLKKYGIKLRKV
jgi:DNA repair exonuclease SbcCD ATPase subunit